MPLSMETLQNMLREEGMTAFFVDPGNSRLMLPATGLNGRYQFVFGLEKGGQVFQMRTIQFLECPQDHPHLEATLKTLGHVNYQYRYIKFGWDPADGEIVGYGDIWIEDGTLTQRQFHMALGSYLTSVDRSYRRLKGAIEKGADPGDEGPAALARRAAGRLPEELRRLLEGAAKGDDDKI